MIDINTKISDLNLPIRVVNCLYLAEVDTVRDLCKTKRSHLLRQRNFGQRSIAVVDAFLNSHCLTYNMTDDTLEMYESFFDNNA